MEPVSRAYLLGLKAQTDEENRIRHVEQYVSNIYSQAKQTARTTTQTSFQYKVLQETGSFAFRDSIFDILARLRSLFPDSSIEYKSLSRGQDGKMYDIVNIDERMKPFINPRHNQDVIVIDWS
jgi:hypothetical protein